MKNKIVILLLSVFSVTTFGFAASVNVEPPLMKISFDRSFTSLEVEDNIAVVLTNETGNEIIAVVVSSMISDRRIDVHLIAYSLKDFGAQLLFIKCVTQPLINEDFW